MRLVPRVTSRVLEFLVVAALATSGLPAWASDIRHFDIPEEGASAAIHDFGEQAHVQILVAGEHVKGKKLHAVSGDLSTEDALNTLLFGSGLGHKYVGNNSIALMPLRESPGPAAGSGSSQPDRSGKGGQAASGSFRLAQADQ